MQVPTFSEKFGKPGPDLSPEPVEAGKVGSSPAQFEFKSIGNQVTPMIKITRAETGTRPGAKARA